MSQTPVFAGVDERSLGNVAATATTLRFARGHQIFAEGDMLDSYHVILKGKVKLFKESAAGKRLTILVLYSGDTFGEMALIDCGPLSVSVQAVEETFVAAISRDTLMPLVSLNPHVAQAITATIVRRCKEIQDRMIDMIACRLEQRIINVLRMLFCQFGMVVPLTHQEIADITGATREATTRVLLKLQSDGVVRSSHGSIILSDEATLDLWHKWSRIRRSHAA